MSESRYDHYPSSNSDLAYAYEGSRKRAIRYIMSPPSPLDALSLSDSPDAALKVYPISKGIKYPSEWAEKAQDRPSSSTTGQAPARSPLASISIVAACTSSLMITSGLCSAVTISLPYVEKDLNIQEDDLQWILSAYSISSVSMSRIPSQSLADFIHRLAFSSSVGDLRISMGANLFG